MPLFLPSGSCGKSTRNFRTQGIDTLANDMSKMQITKATEDRYHVEVQDRFIDEDVNGPQLLGMTSERTVGATAEEILRLFDSQPIGYSKTVDYE